MPEWASIDRIMSAVYCELAGHVMEHIASSTSSPMQWHSIVSHAVARVACGTTDSPKVTLARSSPTSASQSTGTFPSGRALITSASSVAAAVEMVRTVCVCVRES